MDWNYSNSLSDALLAARTNQSDLRFGNSPLYRYSNFDPLITKFKTRPNFYNRPIGAVNLFDDIDELALEVETENLLTSRYRPMNQLNYVPSYFNKNNPNQASVSDNNLNSNSDLFDRNDAPIEGQRSNKIPQQPPKPGKKINKTESLQTKKKPENQNRQPFDNQNQIPVQAHNSQQQRFIQYQQRLAQQQPTQQLQHNDSNLSELEILKIKQQQDRQQLLASLGQQKQQQQQQQQAQQQQTQQPITNQNIYAPFFQPNYLKTHKQYSETSIPSTNADPLNSNNPTPPLFAQRNRDQDYLKASKFQSNKSTDDESGSYLSTLKETRLREQRLAKDKYTANDYKKYQKNYGFGRDFLPFESETKEEKMEKAKKRDEYAKLVKERNNHLTDRYAFNDFAVQKRNQNTRFEPEPAVNNKRANRK